jgi:hypothetical protein
MRNTGAIRTSMLIGASSRRDIAGMICSPTPVIETAKERFHACTP